MPDTEKKKVPQFNFLRHSAGDVKKSIPGYNPAGYKNIHSTMRNILHKKKYGITYDQMIAMAQPKVPAKSMNKKASIFGLREPDEVKDSTTPEDLQVPAYENYVKEKAYEPKTKWLQAAVLPTALATGVARIAAHIASKKMKFPKKSKMLNNKGLWALSALAGITAGGLGASMKITDDARIDTARELVRESNLTDAIREQLEYRNPIIKQRNPATELLRDPNLGNVKPYILTSIKNSL